MFFLVAFNFSCLGECCNWKKKNVFFSTTSPRAPLHIPQRINQLFKWSLSAHIVNLLSFQQNRHVLHLFLYTLFHHLWKHCSCTSVMWRWCQHHDGSYMPQIVEICYYSPSPCLVPLSPVISAPLPNLQTLYMSATHYTLLWLSSQSSEKRLYFSINVKHLYSVLTRCEILYHCAHIAFIVSKVLCRSWPARY